MLKSIQLENFKAFGDARCPTGTNHLDFGQNSAGKSSILQSLNLLKQTRESRDIEALLLPRTENGFVDLGSFQELLFDHDLGRRLSLRLDMTVDDEQRERPFTPRFFRKAEVIGLEFTFSRPTPKDEITFDGFKLCGENPDGCIAEFKQCDMPRDMRRYSGVPYRSERGRGPTVLRATQCTHLVSDPIYWHYPYEWCLQERDRLKKMLTEAHGELLGKRSQPAMRGLFDEDDEPEARERIAARLNGWIRLVSKDFAFGEFFEWMTHEQLGQVVAHEGFIPVMSGRPDHDQSLDVIMSRMLGRPGFRRDWSLDIGMAAVFAGGLFEKTLRTLFPLGPFRKPPARWYIYTGTTPQDVGYSGNLLPDLLLRHDRLKANTNEWLRKLDIGYEIKTRSLGTASADLFELRLVDTRREKKVEVGMSDVGYGISQILPFVVQSLAASRQIISIEQPEVHIHPRLQADLGDLLVESIQEPVGTSS